MVTEDVLVAHRGVEPQIREGHQQDHGEQDQHASRAHGRQGQRRVRRAPVDDHEDDYAEDHDADPQQGFRAEESVFGDGVDRLHARCQNHSGDQGGQQLPASSRRAVGRKQHAHRSEHHQAAQRPQSRHEPPRAVVDQGAGEDREDQVDHWGHDRKDREGGGASCRIIDASAEEPEADHAAGGHRDALHDQAEGGDAEDGRHRHQHAADGEQHRADPQHPAVAVPVAQHTSQEHHRQRRHARQLPHQGGLTFAGPEVVEHRLQDVVVGSSHHREGGDDNADAEDQSALRAVQGHENDGASGRRSGAGTGVP